MQITTVNTQYGICYGIKFERYRKQVVDKFKAQVTGRRWDQRTGLWLVPATAQSKSQIDQFSYYARHFEPIVWGENEAVKKGDEDIAYQLPTMPKLDGDHGLKMEPYEYQKEGIARGLQLKRFINGDDMGLGKQQPVSALVATPKGFRRIGDLSIGDELFGSDGNIYHVDGIYPQTERRVYKVTFSDGISCKCGPEHLWSVRDVNRRRRGNGWVVKTLQEIIDSGITYTLKGVGKNNTRRKWEIPMCEPVRYSEKMYMIHPYIMGVLLGDGAMSGSSLSFSTPDMDYEIVQKVKRHLPGDMMISCDRYLSCPRYNISRNPHVHDNRFIGELKRLRANHLSINKIIPVEYLHGSIEQRIDLLRGLMDTDGSAKKNRITYHTLSYGMAKCISNLVQSLGGQTIIRSYDRTKEGKGIEYQVNVRINICPFHLSRKAKEWSKRQHLSRYIANVEYVGEEESRCIHVTAPDHLYLTNHYIVTHNTLQSIATINKAGAFPCLVICPNVVKINWQREWAKFTDKKAMVLTDSVRDTWPFFWQTEMNQVFIVNYESLKKFFVRRIKESAKFTLRDVEFRETIKLFKSVIIDESHKIKSTATQQTKFSKGIAQGKEWIILLTGTPVVNKPKDLVSQLGVLDRMADFGGYTNFMNRFCSGPNEASNLKELNYLLWKNCFFRREKKDVLHELPDMTRQILTVDIDNRKEYNDAENDLIYYLKKYKEADDDKIATALRGEVMVKIGVLRDIAARGKLRSAVEFVKDFLENDKKIVIFCNLHDIVDRLLHFFPHAVCITGRQDMKEKQAAIDAFVRNPKTNVVICSIKAAGAGVDGLQKSCSDVLFIEEPWTAADRDQAESRVHRNGQKNGATMYHMLGKRTIDQKMWRIIEEKAAISNAVMGGVDNVKTNIVDLMANMFNDTDNEEE